MFKGRIGIWIAVLLSALGIFGIGKFIDFMSDNPIVYVNSDISNDSMFSSIMVRYNVGKYNCIINDESPDLFFTDDLESKNGYTKHENILSSPLVMYVKSSLHNNDSGFVKIPGGSYSYMVDLKAILEAIEEDKAWKDLNIDSKVAKGNVTLYIPNENNSYYDEVIELFIMTLSGSNNLSAEEYNQYAKRVDKIIEKCHKVFDIGQAIHDEYKDSTANHKVFIGPEYLYQRNPHSMGTRSTDAFSIVYFDKTITLYADMFTKDENTEVINQFIDYMFTKSSFVTTTGWRVKNAQYSMSNISSIYKD